MPTLADHVAHSWRADASVPRFDDRRPLIVFDGVCVLCSRSMRFIAGHEQGATLTFTAAQSTLGQALYRHFGLDPTEFETVLILKDGRAYGRRDAMVAIGRCLDQPWRSAMLMWQLLPGRLGDMTYEAIATRRYRLFGRTDACLTPDASWRARVIP